MHYGLMANIFEGGVFDGQNEYPKFLFLQLLWKTPPYGENLLLKSEKNILQISHLVFWMPQAAKYLIHDFTFTFPFFFICSKLNWPLFHLSEIFARKKMMDKIEISIWNIWMWRKWEAKVQHP